ncbi:hypothetical protein BGW37DRAFT_503771 [Umbelopsis sp. PMI_123]|nr:hypothetical protein BGW37DRAFT_503771 [Umbelopsis sp. PMI_123]
MSLYKLFSVLCCDLEALSANRFCLIRLSCAEDHFTLSLSVSILGVGEDGVPQSGVRHNSAQLWHYYLIKTIICLLVKSFLRSNFIQFL